MKKVRVATTCIINGWLSPAYENPRGFSIRFLFANFSAYNTPLIIHKTVNYNVILLRKKPIGTLSFARS